MAYNYCDWTSGNDLSGDGTAALPYKSLVKASTGLTGGDVVRVAKSPAHTELSGTLTFVDGSASVATSVDLTGSIAINDLIGKNADDMCWWRVSDRTASVITLSTVYSGTSQGAVTGYKMGFHDLGTAATQYVTIDNVSVSGISKTNRLKISGGWNLATETQDGESFFKQSGSNQWGYVVWGANYLEIEKLHYARCNDGFIWSESKTGCYIHDVGSYSCGRSGILLNRYNTHMSFGGTIRISQSGSYALYDYNYSNVASSCHNSEADIIFRSCAQITYLMGGNQYWKKFTVKRCGGAVNFLICDNIRIGELIIENSSGVWFDNDESLNITIGKYTATSVSNALGPPSMGTILVYHYIPTGVGNDIVYQYPVSENGRPSVIIQRYGNTNYSGRMYFQGLGIIYQDASNARLTRCLRFAPIHATIPIAWPVGNVKCMNTNLDIDLSAYIKKDNSFNGTIQIAAFVLGQKVVDWTTVSATTSYVQYTLTVPNANLVMTEYVELQVRVNGTTGNAFIDDFSVSQ